MKETRSDEEITAAAVHDFGIEIEELRDRLDNMIGLIELMEGSKNSPSQEVINELRRALDNTYDSFEDVVCGFQDLLMEGE